jgi:hypothetical protein
MNEPAFLWAVANRSMRSLSATVANALGNVFTPKIFAD